MNRLEKSLSVAKLDVLLLRAPIETPRRNAFGVQTSRPALLVRLEDTEGAHGWGEVFANWPPGGAEHRANLLLSIFSGLITAQNFTSPTQLFEKLTAATHLLALQCGEPGPFAQCVSGIDAAAWDLIARRGGIPLWRALSGQDSPHPLPAYASGLVADRIDDLALEAKAAGYRAYKLKVGFDREADLAAFTKLRSAVGSAATLMADANQVWSLAEAREMATALAPFDLAWLEEPLASDAPMAYWRSLLSEAPMPLAAGENMRGEAMFAAADYLKFVQPDVAKWGGISLVYRVASAAVARGQVFCPHYLGGALGLYASAHALAAVGGGGYLEIDVNPNPLRTELLDKPPRIADGQFVLPDAPGLGVEPDLARAQQWRVAAR
jgi:D-galactarolactone cycloisomerase